MTRPDPRSGGRPREDLSSPVARARRSDRHPSLTQLASPLVVDLVDASKGLRLLVLLGLSACQGNVFGLAPPQGGIGDDGRAFSTETPRFGTILLECGGAVDQLLIRNREFRPLEIAATAITNPNGVFEVDLPGPLPRSSLSLGPRETLRVMVQFTPEEVGRFEGGLELVIDGEAVSLRWSAEATDQAVVTERFRQTQTLSTDVVFVIDDSASMREEQDLLRANFRAFLQSADDGLTDYRIAVTTTNVEGIGGRFVPTSTETGDLNGDGVIDEFDTFEERFRARDRWADRSSQPSPEAKFRRLSEVGVSGQGVEKGLEAALLSVSAQNRDAPNFGFFRDDALLSFIFVSDEDDQSEGSVQGLVEELRASKADGNIRASAVVGPVPDGCRTEDEQVAPAPRYAEATRRLGGVTASICAEDWAQVLRNVSGIALGLQTRFALAGRPAELPEVRVDGDLRPPVLEQGTVQWTFDEEDRAVAFETLSTPALGARVEITYPLACE